MDGPPSKKRRTKMGDTTIKEVEEIPLEDGRITFNPNLEPIQSFLRRFPPSSTSATLADWIQVRHPSLVPRGNSSYDDTGALAKWKSITKKGTTITCDTVKEVGVKYSIFPGKWLIFYSAQRSSTMELMWNNIAMAITKETISATDAKISTKGRSYILCVYTKDFTDVDDVMSVREQLRKLGVTRKINYKADIYTILDIYKKNEWNLPETIYSK